MLGVFVVLHKDIRAANMLWNAERGCAMLIDFELSDIFDRPRPPLRPTSPNLKRKRSFKKGITQVRNDPDADARLGEIYDEEELAVFSVRLTPR